MKKLSILLGAFAALAAPALAADDPVAVRQALMSSNGASAAVTGGVMKGELDYSPAVGKAVVESTHGVAMAFGEFFPEGSGDGEKTKASPKIWSDRAGFDAALEKFRSATNSALEASGKDGPADAEAFKTAMQPVLNTCKNCHETYRVDN